MKKLTATFIAVGIIAGASPVVMAEDGTSFNVAATSNYVWRGLTQTNDGAAVQAGADMTSGDLSLGVWASNVVGGTEVDAYGSYAIDKASVGAIYYYFTAGGSTYEVNAGYDFGIASAMVSYDPGLSNTYLEVGGSTEVSKGVNLDWHVGNNSTGSVTDYLLGVSGAFSGIDVSAAYASTTATGAQGKFFVTAGKTF